MRQFDVAVVGAGGMVAEAIMEYLAERGFPIGRLFPLGGSEAAVTAEFRGRHLPVGAVPEFDFSQVQIAFFAGGAELSDRYAPEAAEAGALVIDASGCFHAVPDIPLVVAEVNPDHLEAYRERNIVAVPSAAATLVAQALLPIHRNAGLERVNAVLLQSVSGRGRAGVEELASQTAKLLNVQPVESRVFSRQIAFNVLPRVGDPGEDGYSSAETILAGELQRLFALPDLAVNPTVLEVPVFFGHAAVLHVETRNPPDLEWLRQAYSAAEKTELMDDAGEGGFPTAVTEAAGDDALYIGRLREDLSHPRGLDLWAVADNIRRGAALNAVRVAEVLTAEYL